MCPTPTYMKDMFLPYSASLKTAEETSPPDSEDALFINAQWALGGPGTGAPVHFHNTAWNVVVYGAKKWFLYPPRHKVMSNRQIYRFYETDLQRIANKTGFQPLTCVQRAGDIMIVPESWGHGVLNLQVTAPEILRKHGDDALT